jgi:anthranilate phosphoribosyltransferase
MDCHSLQKSIPFPATKYIREIGRGAKNARGLSKQDTQELFSAMLTGNVSDMELGALLMAWRIKGESTEELAGMLDAAHLTCHYLSSKATNTLQSKNSAVLPVVIPSYNGARKQPNLVPLLAMLLAREGVPVLVHGTTVFSNRTTSAMIFKELGVPICATMQDAENYLANDRLAFLPIEVLSPELASMLAKRDVIGVRNSAHTIVKMLQPIGNHQEDEALRLVNYTHPEYLHTLTEYFSAYSANVLLARGTEGEAVADARRRGNILRIVNGQRYLAAEVQKGSVDTIVELPDGLDIKATADYIKAVLAGSHAVPKPILEQVKVISQIAFEAINQRSGAEFKAA